MDVEAHFEEVSIAIQLPYNHQISQSKRSQILGYLKVLDFVGKYVASLILETWLGRSDLSYEQCEILVTWKVDESRFSNIKSTQRSVPIKGIGSSILVNTLFFMVTVNPSLDKPSCLLLKISQSLLPSSKQRVCY